MIIKRILLVTAFIVVTNNVFAKVFFKDNPTAPVVTQLSNDKSEIDCERNGSKSCQGIGRPTKFTAFGDCKVISTSNGRQLFIPARTRVEWGNFMGWAQQHPDIVTVNSCTDPQWTDWTACTNMCGKGTRERKCNRPSQSNHNSSCIGQAQQDCLDFTSCECGPLEKRAVFCEGQDRKFTSVPPDVAYVDFEKCDHSTKCQARCPEGRPALPDAKGCSGFVSF